MTPPPARPARRALAPWLLCAALAPAAAHAQSAPSSRSPSSSSPSSPSSPSPSSPSPPPSSPSPPSPAGTPPAAAPAAAPPAAAPPAPASKPAPSPARLERAREHFRRGVAAYKRADYRTALVEFRRSHEITGDARVLFNLGETHWQLHDYGEAMNAFTRYLERAEAIPAARRGALEPRLAELRERVGRVEVRATGGAALTLDGDPLGPAPLATPFFVSAGRHKFAASPGVARTVDVAGGDELDVDLSPEVAAPAPAPPPAAPAAAAPAPPAPPSNTLAWGMTGAAAALGAGAALLGFVAINAKQDYDHEVETFPADHDHIDDARGRTRAFGITADVLGVAAVGTGAFAAYLWLSRPRHPANAAGWGLQVAGPALVVKAQF